MANVPAITITEPVSYNVAHTTTLVRCSGGATGLICACGSVSPLVPQLIGVWGQVLAGATAGFPQDHSGAVPGTIDAAAGLWSFTGNVLVPGAPCNDPHPQQDNATFFVWCDFSGGTGVGVECRGSTPFAAQQSNMTNCDGSDNPCGERLRLSRPGRATTVAVETAPRQYEVKGQGARGPQACRVNTTWALALRTGGCGCTFAWDNGGDGIRVPRVVLRPDGLISTEWNVTLVLDGRRAQYTCPAEEWKVLGTNRLRRASGDASMPTTLIVTPV